MIQWIENKAKYLEDREETGKYAEKNSAQNQKTAATLRAINSSDLPDDIKKFTANLTTLYHFNYSVRQAYFAGRKANK